MPFAHSLAASECSSSPHVAEAASSGFPCSLRSRRSVQGYGLNSSSFETFAGKSSPHLPSRVAQTRRPRNSTQNVISCDHGEDNLRYGYDGRLHGMHASCRSGKGFKCSAQFTDTGYSDTDMYVPALEDSYEKSLFLASPTDAFYPPHPEALDPFSQLLYEHAMGRNLHWWRFLSYCRSQLSNTLSLRRYSLVGRSYRKVLLPTRFTAQTLTVPAISLPLQQDPFSTALDRINLMANEFFGWFSQLGNRYGSSLLCLLVLGYWIQGFRCFPWMAMSFYLKDELAVSPATSQFWLSTVNLPMVAKPVYGIISDVIYIGGERRMPYLMVAGALQALSWSTVALHSGVRSSIGPLMGVLLVSNVGAAIAEVVNDALVAEAVQKEKGRSKGELQSYVWLALAIGGVVGNLTGGLALARVNSTTMLAIFATLAAGHLVVSTVVKEKSFDFKVTRPLASKDSSNTTSALKVLRLQAGKLINLVSMPEIALPLAWFAASYAVIPAMGGTLFFYQTQYLKIHPSFLGFAKVMGQMGLLAGSLIFNRYLKGSSPRKLLMAVQILLSVCMMSDILLVTRVNIKLGIPDQLFVLGASAFCEAIGQFKVLPFSVLLTQLCPAGSEGSLLAFFMSCHCLAIILSGYMGTILASFLHLSVENFAGLPLGIVLQSLAALIPLFWISCIPDSAAKVATL